MGYEQENAQKITAAFQKLTQRKDLMITTALTKAFDEAMDFAMDLHRQMHLGSHLEHGDDYGWMIVHEGTVMGKHFYEGEKPDGTAKGILESLSWVSGRGWEAVLMAGMVVANYKWPHEEEIMGAVEGDLAAEIQNKFRDAWSQVKAV